MADRLSVSTGLRAKGAGTKAQLAELNPAIRTWFEKRRSAWHYIDASALIIQFEYVMRICTIKLTAKTERLELTLDEIKKFEDP